MWFIKIEETVAGLISFCMCAAAIYFVCWLLDQDVPVKWITSLIG